MKVLVYEVLIKFGKVKTYLTLCLTTKETEDLHNGDQAKCFMLRSPQKSLTISDFYGYEDIVMIVKQFYFLLVKLF